jgi:hypothetical protein
MGSMAVRSPVLLAAAAALSACSGGSQGQPPKELKSILSWVATVQMVLHERRAGSIPVAYARRTLDRAENEIAKNADKLRQSEETPTPTGELTRLQRAVGAARQGLERPENGPEVGEAIEASVARLRARGWRGP